MTTAIPLLSLSVLFVAIHLMLRTRRRLRRAHHLVHQLRDRISGLEADLHHADADLSIVSAELDHAYLGVASVIAHLTAERDRAEHSEGRAIHRSIARRGDAEHALLAAAVQLGRLRMRVEELERSVSGRDAAIEALTARVAELLPCHDRIAFVDGELEATQAAAFRLHLGGCAVCRQAMPEDVQLAARLSTLGGSGRRE